MVSTVGTSTEDEALGRPTPGSRGGVIDRRADGCGGAGPGRRGPRPRVGGRTRRSSPDPALDPRGSDPFPHSHSYVVVPGSRDPVCA